MKLEFGTGSAFAKLSKKKASSLVKYAIDLGVRRFDSGVNYGNWKTQPFLGCILKDYLIMEREKFIINTKAGTHSINSRKAYKNFSPDYIENMINKSIYELNCNYIDNFYLHGPNLNQIETEGLLQKIKKLKAQGKIRSFGVCSHDIKTIQRISNGFYDEINGLMLDYNLLQQNRADVFDNCKQNNIKIIAITVLCQGLLLQSPLANFIRSRNMFYLIRSLISSMSKQYIYSAKITRSYMKNNFPLNYKSIPLSFVLNNQSISSIPIGMLSKSSIKQNIMIANNPIDKKITDNVAKWTRDHSQILK